MNIALAIILHPNDDGVVLIAQRKEGVHLAGFWEFPGGKCLDGEAPGECAVRETREETGLEVDVLEAWPVVTHDYPDRTVMLHPFLCRAHTERAEARESRQVVWAAVPDLGAYALPDANAPLLARLGTIHAALPGNALWLPAP